MIPLRVNPKNVPLHILLQQAMKSPKSKSDREMKVLVFNPFDLQDRTWTGNPKLRRGSKKNRQDAICCLYPTRIHPAVTT